MTSTAKEFDIKRDLQDRSLAEQVEILWISGPTWHDSMRIALILGISEVRVLQLVHANPRIA